MVTPLVFAMLFGLLEFGFVFKDKLTISNASRAGARSGAAAGSNPMADYQILRAVASGTSSLAKVDRVVVFRGTSVHSPVPPACTTANAGIAGVCNVYDGSDLSISGAAFSADGYTKDDFWAASSRITSLSAPSGPDYLGVWVRADHLSVLQSVIPSRALTDAVLMRLEPTR